MIYAWKLKLYTKSKTALHYLKHLHVQIKYTGIYKQRKKCAFFQKKLIKYLMNLNGLKYIEQVVININFSDIKKNLMSLNISSFWNLKICSYEVHST
jgi:hypothetical protein